MNKRKMAFKYNKLILLILVTGLVAITAIRNKESIYIEYKKHYGRTIDVVYLQSPNSFPVAGISSLADMDALRTYSNYGLDSLSHYSWNHQPLFFKEKTKVEVLLYLDNNEFALIRFPNSTPKMDDIGAVYVHTSCIYTY